MFTITETSAPLAALFFKDPRVTDVIRVVGFNFLFTIPSLISNTLLIKKLQFKALVLIRSSSALLQSALAVYLVLSTNLRYWCLVIPMLIAILFEEVTIFIVVGWRPKFLFDKQSFKYLFRYGINGLGFSITNYLHQNIDYLLVGRLLGSMSLGLYQFAYQIPHLILDRFARPVGSVVFPALSKVQDSDERLIAGYIKAAKYIALGAFPALGGLAVLADLIVTVLWGEKWLPIVTPLRILCLCAAVRCVVTPIGSIFLCKQRPDINFKFGVATFLLTMTAVATLGPLYGLNGVASGMLISTLSYLYIINLAFKMTAFTPVKLSSALWAPTAATGISMMCAYGVRYLLASGGAPSWIALVCSVASGAIGYIAWLFVIFRPTVVEVTKTAHTVIGGRASKTGIRNVA